MPEPQVMSAPQVMPAPPTMPVPQITPAPQIAPAAQIMPEAQTMQNPHMPEPQLTGTWGPATVLPNPTSSYSQRLSFSSIYLRINILWGSCRTRKYQCPNRSII
jgi:hypothetical protein